MILNHSDKSIHVLDHFENVLWLDNEHRFLVLVGGAGSGKAVPLDTKVITPKGYVRMRDIKVGQTICSTKGSLEKVIWKSDVQHVDLYKLTFADGREVIACKDHMWKYSIDSKVYKNGKVWKVATTEQLIELMDAKKDNKRKKNLMIPLPEPVFFHDKCLRGIDPYVLGLILGDGHITPSNKAYVYTADEEIVEYVESTPYIDSVYLDEHRVPSFYRIGLKGVKKEIEKTGLAGTKSTNKFIPDKYKFSSIEKRWELLRGLMDTDGTCDKTGNPSFCTISHQLALDVQWLVRSLGGYCTISEKIPKFSHEGIKKDGQKAYILYIRFGTDVNPFKLSRKAERFKGYNGGHAEPKLRIESIEYIGKGDAQCIAVDDDESLYMIDDFVVTHNSHAICQRISYLFLTQEDVSIAVVRRTMPALKRSVYKGNPSIMKTLIEFGAPAYDWLNSTDFKLTNPHNGSTIQFIGLDDPEKVKSDNYNYIWVEEATEINANIWMQLNARLRRPQPHRINQMFLSYNPVSHSNWAVQTFSASGDSEIKKYSNVHFSTFIDNHYVSLSDVLTWFLNAKRDENWYRTYILGIPSVPQGQIYPNISFSPSKMWPKEVWNTKPYYGIDWGFNHPMCLVELRDYKDKTYGRTLFHEREKTTSDLIRFMNEHKLPKSAHYYCDSAERDRIAELGRAGYSVFKAKKNVLAGIAHVRSLKITYDNTGKLGARSADELIEYCWEPDPDNPGEFFDKPLELKDETPDCVRYATYTHHMYGGEVQYAQLDLSDFGKRLNLINGDETEGDDIDRFSW